MSEATIEKRIVASCLKSREAFEKIRKYVDTSKFSPYGEWTVQQVSEYYDKDVTAKSVSTEHLLDLTKLRFDNPSKATLYAGYVSACDVIDVSPLNLANLILEQRRKVKGAELSQVLANDTSSPRALTLIEEFQEVSQDSFEEEKPERYNNVSVEEINKKVIDVGGRIKLAPRCINKHIKGGVLPGHHIIVYARPETGKTTAVLSLIRAFVLQKLPGIYFGNEDPILDIISRAQSCISGMSEEARLANPKTANEALARNGYGYVTFQPLTPGTPREIEQHIVELKPRWIIVDQIRNLNVKADTRVNQLEAAASFMRNVGKKHELVSVSVTQAGDSADNKLVLGMGDIDFSNTGIPATGDLMIGIGVDEHFERNQEVMYNLPKNKIGGKHEHWAVRLNKDLSRMESLENG